MSKEQTMLVPPNVMMMITGVHYITISAGGKVTLVYTDGSTESIKTTIQEREGKDFLALVSYVQSKREAA